MAPLNSNLRRDLENAIIAARDVAVEGSREAIMALTVHEGKRGHHLNQDARSLRNRLRARGRQIGDDRDPKSGTQEIEQLAQECAYEHWHRMIFARFLAENNLLVEPDSKVSVTLEEVEELARDEGVDQWELAARYAQQELPAIFRSDDPLLAVTLPRETRLSLERLLEGLQSELFQADDSLGWAYQYWQSAEKERVNESGEKITGDTLSAVTQLFTEPYMVQFLLHNTLGAWHAGKCLSGNPDLVTTASNEAEVRAAVALTNAGGYEFEYLRFVRSTENGGAEKEGENADGPWQLMGGAFDGWPRTAAELKVLDPCCGSGHFLVAAFGLLLRLRMHEEGLSPREAARAVLSDNLYGLELDARCTQIAVFALALAAWTLPDANGEKVGFFELPETNVACTGIGPEATEDEWLKLAEQSGLEMPAVSREPILNGLRNLHALFSDAPTLGSLINPSELPRDLITADYETLKPYLDAALDTEQADDDTHERAIAAAGMVRAAAMLADEYTLVITNVPYLGSGKQGPVLQEFTESTYSLGKADLSTAFVLRCDAFLRKGGSCALVTPQNWLFLATYERLRKSLLVRVEWNVATRLGTNAFRDMNWWAATTALVVLSHRVPKGDHHIACIDVGENKDQAAKAELLCGERTSELTLVCQQTQLENPGTRIVFDTIPNDFRRLDEFATATQGISPGDTSRMRSCFWEVDAISGEWVLLQSTPSGDSLYDGLSYSLLDPSSTKYHDLSGFRMCGDRAWGKVGIAVGKMASLPAAIYVGGAFDANAPVLSVESKNDLAPIWEYVSSPEYARNVRALDQKSDAAVNAFDKVHFDFHHWQQVAAKKYPDGLPEPESDDPTQWLFHGRPDNSTSPLQAAVARLLGYRWPAELDSRMQLSSRARELVKSCDELLSFADRDGIVCIPAVRSEEGAAIRLRRLLDACDVEVPHDLDSWLRNDFFKEHCDVFHNIPLVWHIWDGRKNDGFHALVNYHKLAGPDGHKLLESLTYSYLGDWISRQDSDVKSGAAGADGRLAAAKSLQEKLKEILAGEPPYDIFVRWKPLHEQPIGWHPDINDGVRMNIRPFTAVDIEGGRKGAGIMRLKPNIKWKKDRGKEPERPREDFPWFWDWDEETQDFAGGETFTAERWNDCHYTHEFKQAARDRKAQEGEA